MTELLEAEVAGKIVLPWEPLKIMPIGDIQYAGKGKGDPADMARLKRHVQWGVDNDCWFIGMGDYIDFARPSARRKLAEMGRYDEVTEDALDWAATEMEDYVLRALAPTKGRWLTLVEGHHYYEHQDGTTTGQRFAKELGCQYGGDAVMMRLTFANTGKKRAITKVFIHHGHGGGGTLAGPIAKYERFAAHNMCQIFFIGHHHRIMVVPFDALDMTSKGKPTLFHHTRAIVLTGSFLRGYLEGHTHAGRPQGTYVEKAMLPPVALGGPLVTLTPKQDGLVHLRGSV